MLHKEIWKDTGDFWNVLKAEEDIREIIRVSKIFNIDRSIAVRMCGGDEKYTELMNEVGLDMQDVISGKGQKLNYHLNHIVSGETVYELYNNNGKQYMYGEQFYTEEEANEHCSRYEDAYVDSRDGEEKCYIVWVLDEEGTKHLRDINVGGEFIKDFDSREEAEDEGKRYDSYYIEEYPSDEMYVVINDKTGKNELNMIFPYEERALAFLYKRVMPDNFVRLLNYESEGK